MLFTLTTTHKPATDLGFLLHKNPARLHSTEMPYGQAHVFYPEATEERCTVALLLEVDPVRLVRGREGPKGEGGRFDQYVNDRPYVASSFLSTALTEFFSTAMSGRSKERQELAESAIPLEAHLPTLPCRGGEPFLRRLFEPLGYEVEAERIPLDEHFDDWGGSPYYDVKLRKTGRVCDMLHHLYVLIPVLDDEKHYWVGIDEVEKLLRRGKEWLADHPEREEITRRYLRRQKHLTREALARLAEESLDPDQEEAEHDLEELIVERPLSLHEIRLDLVAQKLKESGARRVIDLGCGEGRLLAILRKDRQFEDLVGMDVSYHMLERAARRLHLEGIEPMGGLGLAALSEQQRPKPEKVRLIHGSLMYRDRRLQGFDAAAVVEVVEHLDPPRLAAFERILFEFAKPRQVVLTTPNREYNELFTNMPQDRLRHRDHRFEWTRAEFESWAKQVAERHNYEVTLHPIGPEDPERGSPSQMAIFTAAAQP
jgi:3' terminal RNA ribose 2'-O-methyltransferase Hen1